MEFSRCARTGIREKTRPEDGLSKLNSVRFPFCGARLQSGSANLDSAEVDVLLGELEVRTAEAIKRFERLPE